MQGKFDFGPSELGPYGSETPPPLDPRGRRAKRKCVITRPSPCNGQAEYARRPRKGDEGHGKIGWRTLWTFRHDLADVFDSTDEAEHFRSVRVEGHADIIDRP